MRGYPPRTRHSGRREHRRPASEDRGVCHSEGSGAPGAHPGRGPQRQATQAPRPGAPPRPGREPAGRLGGHRLQARPAHPQRCRPRRTHEALRAQRRGPGQSARVPGTDHRDRPVDDEPAREREPVGAEVIGERTRDAMQYLKAQGKRHCYAVFGEGPGRPRSSLGCRPSDGPGAHMKGSPRC